MTDDEITITFPCSVSSLAWFMSNQETSFVTIGQRVLARPLKYETEFHDATRVLTILMDARFHDMQHFILLFL